MARHRRIARAIPKPIVYIVTEKYAALSEQDRYAVAG